MFLTNGFVQTGFVQTALFRRAKFLAKVGRKIHTCEWKHDTFSLEYLYGKVYLSKKFCLLMENFIIGYVIKTVAKLLCKFVRRRKKYVKISFIIFSMSQKLCSSKHFLNCDYQRIISQYNIPYKKKINFWPRGNVFKKADKFITVQSPSFSILPS